MLVDRVSKISRWLKLDSFLRMQGIIKSSALSLWLSLLLLQLLLPWAPSNWGHCTQDDHTTLSRTLGSAREEPDWTEPGAHAASAFAWLGLCCRLHCFAFGKCRSPWHTSVFVPRYIYMYVYIVYIHTCINACIFLWVCGYLFRFRWGQVFV